MTHLTFYGGIGEIGGNKILLEDQSKSLFLDFGLSYSRRKKFYEEYLNPRAGAGLLDYLIMGLIPPLEGAYRTDLEPENVWEGFKSDPLYRKLEHVDGVLLTHAHFDHSGNISFLDPAINVYTTAATAFLVKAIQDCGKSDLEHQIGYYTTVSSDCPKGCRQIALLSNSEAKKQRKFHIPENQLKAMNSKALEFWRSGLWESTGRKKELESCELRHHGECSFNIRCLPVDHSIPGACAWGIETESGWVVYSGDLRLHGKKRELTDKFIEEVAKLHPKVLIIEGTNIRRETNVSEKDVYNNALRAVQRAKGLVIADFSARDIDRLLTFLEVARETGRKLAILPKDAYLLKTLALLGDGIPDIATDKNIVIYQDTTSSKYPMTWLRNIYEEYDTKVVLAEDVKKSQTEFMLAFSFFDINELPGIMPAPGSLYLFSSSEPHDEEQEMDFSRLHNWLRHFGIKSYGLPIEVKGEWQIPEDEKGLHASGHACGRDLVAIAREINPEILIPIHSEHPEDYVEALSASGIKIILPEANRPQIEV